MAPMMKDTIARDSRHMLIVAPDPDKVSHYQPIVPLATVVDAAELLHEIDSRIERHFLSLIGSITSLMHLVSTPAKDDRGDSVELF